MKDLLTDFIFKTQNGFRFKINLKGTVQQDLQKLYSPRNLDPIELES